MHRIASFTAAALLSACATTGGEADRIRGVEWRATDIAGQDPVGGAPATLRLQRDRSLAGGSTGCNIWSADYRLGAGTVEITDLTSTRRACPEPLLEQERAYLSVLQQVDRYVLWPDGALTLAGPAGRTVTFRPVAAAQP